MNLDELICNIIGNAINGLMGGIAGSFLTIIYDKKKEKMREEKERYNNKPELMVNKANFENEEEIDEQLLIAVFDVHENMKFKYSEKYNNKKEYIFKDYILKNIGKRAIEQLEIVTTNKEYNSVFDVNQANTYMENGIIKHAFMWDRKIFPNGELRVRIYFHKDMIVTSSSLAPFIIQYIDSKGMYWEQSFFENEYKIYSPREITYKEYRENKSKIEIVRDKSMLIK